MVEEYRRNGERVVERLTELETIVGQQKILIEQLLSALETAATGGN